MNNPLRRLAETVLQRTVTTMSEPTPAVRSDEAGTANSVLELSSTAEAKVAELLRLEHNSELALRVAVRPGGCSGFSYEMFFDADRSADDHVARFGSVEVLVDAASTPLLTGSTLEYYDTLAKTGFEIRNPNAQRSCGCGKSFS